MKIRYFTIYLGFHLSSLDILTQSCTQSTDALPIDERPIKCLADRSIGCSYR